MDLTREDMERWPKETLVAFEEACSRSAVRVVTPGAVLWTLESAQAWTHYYEFEHDHETLFGIQNSYENWIGGIAAAPLSIESLDRIMREMRYNDCPLHRCEDFTMRQTSWPVSREPGGMSMWQPGDWIQMRGEALADEVARIVDVNRETRTITLMGRDPTRRVTPGMSHRRHVKRAPDPRAKPSRVPPLPERRLDGRRKT